MTGSLCRFSADDLTTRSSGRRPQSAKARNRGDGSCDGRAASYGDLATRRDGRVATAIPVEQEYNLYVPARKLLNGDFTFCPIHDFNELGSANKQHSTTSA